MYYHHIFILLQKQRQTLCKYFAKEREKKWKFLQLTVGKGF